MDIREKIKKLNCGEIILDASLKKYNTYNVDSTALAIVFPKDIQDLKNIIEFAKNNLVKIKVLGNGSNLIFVKDYYETIFINLKYFNNFELNENIVVAQSGVNLMKLAYHVSRMGLTGMEFATGIPATVGGAVYMNAGAYNSDISNILVGAKILTDNLEIVEYSNDDFDFSYRFSCLQKKSNYICLEATFKLDYGDKEDVLNLINDRKNRRISTQPLEYPSAGSIFRNPSKEIFAGRLIEELNLKGKKIGGAQISEKHANFVINVGNATGIDIKNLILETKNKVKDKYNIELKVEQEFVE